MKKALLLVLLATFAVTVYTERPLRIETRGPEVGPPIEGDDATGTIIASYTPFVSATNTVCSIVPSTTIAAGQWVSTP